MKSEAIPAKVIKKLVGSDGANGIRSEDGRFSGEELHGSIDSHMLDWLKSLDLPEKAEGSFVESLGIYLEQLGNTLQKARRELHGTNPTSLEGIALDLSHNALKIGAINILRASFELQNLARCGAYRDAQDIVDQIEVEYLKVQQSLENVV
ncbi:MAG: hypothetical protein ACOH5I_04330 [Oligoflexus sp.]